MNWDIILTALGSGGIATLINWWTNRKLISAKNQLERDNISREMREKDSKTIKELYDENRNLWEKFYELQRQVAKIVSCEYYINCPVRYELQDLKANSNYQRNHRQPVMEQKGIRHPRDYPNKSGDDPDSDRQSV